MQRSAQSCLGSLADSSERRDPGRKSALQVDRCDRSMIEAVSALTTEAFRTSAAASAWEGRGRVLQHGGQPKAALQVHRFHQFFGGRAVAAAGLASVVVAPETRGMGLGRSLVSTVLDELRQDGVAVSTLYPTSIPFYRSVGYEIAGTRVRYGSPVLPLARYRAEASVEPLQPSTLEGAMRCYRFLALRTNGLLDRSRSWWEDHVLAPIDERKVYAYLVRSHDDVVGYIAYDQLAETDVFDYWSLACRDFMWTTPEAARSLLGFVSGQGALAHSVSWSGPSADPLLAFFGQREVRIEWSLVWMARILDVRAALEARGYPPGVRASIDFAVHDGLFEANHRSFRLEIENGRGIVSAGQRTTPTMSIGALSAMYTGWLRPSDATRLGLLRGSQPYEEQTLELMFGGPSPWLLDAF